ncbi:MAG TPA: GreA/GreB family elongation factor [Puia sp.]|jgi:regulator of nucleoside diphosphate kinase|nr:GreA/GreB family elongation factor [Puia sp.]
MENKKNKLVLHKNDYDTLLSYSKDSRNYRTFDQRNVVELLDELKKGEVIDHEDFPADAVRINSRVKVEDRATKRVLNLMLVLPDKADVSKGKVSVMAPIGVALLGYRKGQEVTWEVPAGKKHFKIVEVQNAAT